MLVLKKYVKLSFILLITTLFVVGCGKNENDQEEPVNDDPEVLNNENNEIEDQEENENEEEGSAADDQEFSEASLDLRGPLEDIKEFYNSIYFSDVDIIDPEEGLIGIEVSKSIIEDFYQASINAYTIDPQTRMTLVVNSGEDEFEEQADKNNLSGDAMAEEVKEDVYEFAESLIWKEEGNSYRLKGGRNVISTVEEDNIRPEDDRLLFYESLAKTNNELDDVHDFLDKIIIPTTLPSGYELSLVTVEKNTKEIITTSTYPIELLYGLRSNGGDPLYIITYGEYEQTPQLFGEGVEEIEIEGVTIQSKEDEIMFTLGDQTYRINYGDIAVDDVLEIAKSMIEQFN